MEPTKEELEAEAERIASGTYYGGPNHEEPFDGDQAAEEAEYSFNAAYDYVREAHAADFNQREAEINAAMEAEEEAMRDAAINAALDAEEEAMRQAEIDNAIVAQEPLRPYRAPGCTCTDYQLVQVGCDCRDDPPF